MGNIIKSDKIFSTLMSIKRSNGINFTLSSVALIGEIDNIINSIDSVNRLISNRIERRVYGLNL
jgi:hypothetical protein